MPIPRHSVALASVQLPAAADCGGLTELRVHGVGGTPPDVILGDLAPEQASGDRIAGFYRTADHRASSAGRDADRHVECYSWGGLTSRSKSRVLWLALLPFLLGNLAGWMCSARTRASRWRFGLHRLSHGLAALALTVNGSLIAATTCADVLAYQAPRAGLAGHQWWLAPLGWPGIAGHPARQLLAGVLAPVLLLLLVAWLASRSWRYEAVRPPAKGGPAARPRKVTAAALDGGLASDSFWDGESSVRLLTRLHIAVAAGFLAIMLAVTARAVSAAGPGAWWWIAVGAGGATAGLAVIYICLDAFGALSDGVRGSVAFLLVPAAAALASAGVLAWRQPAGPAGHAAGLPGMTGVVRWTALAIALTLATALVSALAGMSRRGRGTFAGGPWVTLVLAFSVLNTVMLGAQIWVAHLVGPVTSSAMAVPGHIYLPYGVTSGVPLVALAAVAAGLAFGLAELARWWLTRRLPAEVRRAYQIRARTFAGSLPAGLRCWYRSGIEDDGWERGIARARFLGGALLDAGWLLWGIVIAQLAMALCAWLVRFQPPALLRAAGVALAGLALPTLMGFLYSAWHNPARRRTIGILWDVGTFWPRSYHPLSPPCYTERAVPELQRRMWWLHDNGGQVVLIAHSQGAMLATAALVQSGCRLDGLHPALITFGSPVAKLYGWAFPAYVTPELLASLAPGGPARLSDWRNRYYPTDPIGGPAAGHLPAADGSRVDQALPDPAQCWYVYGQDPPGPKGHSGYWSDPRVWELVNEVAASSAVPGDQVSGESAGSAGAGRADFGKGEAVLIS